MAGLSDDPFCVIDGEPATWERMLPVAVQNYGHITMFQMRRGMVRGLRHHLERLEGANRELFGRALPSARLIESLKATAAARPDATIRINLFAGDESEHVMVTATAPIEPDWRPARFSLVPYERDMPHLKHVGSFGLLLRQRQAVARGFDGAIFFDEGGEISEATIWNVGFLEGDKIVWPSAPALRGISQIIIDEGLSDLGIDVRYEPVRIEALGRFGAAFLSNSATFGRLLSGIGSHCFETPVAASDLIRRAYEQTKFEPLPA